VNEADRTRMNPTEEGLSHVDGRGRAVMVDVGSKPVTARRAVAEGFVRIGPELERAIRSGSVAKGPVLETARLAGIMAAKRTDELIPMCHSIPLDSVDVEATLEPGRGIEMEALVAVSAACLTVFDMGKALDRSITIDGIRVLEKHGGRSGSHVAKGHEAKRA
jgi:cyclic pyranopterin phosphate synthase